MYIEVNLSYTTSANEKEQSFFSLKNAYFSKVHWLNCWIDDQKMTNNIIDPLTASTLNMPDMKSNLFRSDV